MKIVIIILCTLFLSSCGQYGALYLPGAKDGTKKVPEATQHQIGDAAKISSTI